MVRAYHENGRDGGNHRGRNGEPVLPDSLRAAIVAAFEDDCKRFLAWLTTHWEADFTEREAFCLDFSRQQATTELTWALAVAGTRRIGRCPHCGAHGRPGPLRRTRRRVLSTCGLVPVTRRRATCHACGRSWLLADGLAGWDAHQRLSATLRGWLVGQGVRTTFRDAAAAVAELTGIDVDHETIRRHTEATGTAIAVAEEQAAATTLATDEAAEPVDPAPGRLVIEADGAMIPEIGGWREAKIGVVGGVVNGATTALSYIATRQPVEAFGRRLVAEAARRGALEVVDWDGELRGSALAILRPVVVLGDGAPWIWNLAAEHFGERIEIVDWYHASQHLWRAATAACGEGSIEGVAWVACGQQALWERGGAALRVGFAWLGARHPEAAETLRAELAYFEKNAERLGYASCHDQGLPIGSGAVESAAKQIAERRLKGPGMRWTPDGSEAMLALCARKASNRPLQAA
jgi:hypothetical protein